MSCSVIILGLLFVGLPLRLYLADSPHLYELIRRMRGLSFGGVEADTKEMEGRGDLKRRSLYINCIKLLGYVMMIS